MKMSPQYLRETAQTLNQCGYALRCETIEEPKTQSGDGYRGIRYHLQRNPSERLILECIEAPNQAPSYFLQWEDYHGLSCTSFPLDSWKHFDDHVEFKFYTLPDTGMGLSFQLVLTP